MADPEPTMIATAVATVRVQRHRKADWETAIALLDAPGGTAITVITLDGTQLEELWQLEYRPAHGSFIINHPER